ncbi:uncharacterized protein LOC105765319 [Gossypium raimondii]|uniref:uncharacterized protein LOC105765319 n=1 Tax=Gossypium raimondii TaxID=29730 RepID=UPI00063AEF76|nr:uncharacterized protein LOC105765319 [Gossypium raimondii]
MAQRLSPPLVPQPVPIVPQGLELVRVSKPSVDQIRKYGAEEFRCISADDPEIVEFWLENTIRVFNELPCTPMECLKCVVSLLKDSAYQWWNTLAVVSRERVDWEFFQTEFRKKYVSQRFLDKKRKEFLELKQGQMTVSKYEREFVRLSKYAREFILIEVSMCPQFEDGLNEGITLLVEILELKKFVVLVDRAHKAEELSKKKRKADSSKRSAGKSYKSPSKKSKEYHGCSSTLVGYSSKD